jgi:hypothetical protein
MGSIKRGMAALLAASCVVVSACSGGGSGSVDIAPAPELEAVNSSSGLKPDSNGFAFANFGSSASQEVFDESDLVEMFGESVCVDGVVDPCAPTEEAAAWARMVNDSRAVGHCEGLVVQAALRYSAKLDPQTVTLKNEGDVTHGIMRAFATQFLPEVQKSTKAWSKRSLKDIVAELASSFKTGGTNYTLGVYSPNGGHAVLPYAVEFPTPERADILLYDSNWPGITRKVVVDLATDTWYFSFDNPDPNVDPSADASAWSGNSGSMDITPMDSRSNATCPMCGGDTVVRDTILTIRSVDGDWSIKTKNGLVTATVTEQVEGTRVTSLRGASGTVTDSVVSIEGSEFELTLNSTANVYVNNVHGTAEIRATGKRKRTPIVFKDNSISFSGTDADVLVAKEDLAVNTLVSDATINVETDRIDVLTTSEGAEKTLSVDASQPRVVITGGGDKPVVENRDKILNSVLPIKVDELAVPDVRGKLTPRVERDLSNPAYVQQYSIGAAPSTTVAATTMTVAVATTPATTTTLPAGAPTSTPSATTVTSLKSATLSSASSFSPGGAVNVSYSGFEPNEWVQLIVASTPQVIDVEKASASGKVTLSGQIPNSLSAGSHTLAVYAPQSKRGFKQSITVQAVTTASQATTTVSTVSSTTTSSSSVTTGTNTPATTAAPTATTTSPTTVPAGPVATTNSPPTITTFSCVSASASKVQLRVIASDPNGSNITIRFEEPNSSYYIEGPTYSDDGAPSVYYPAPDVYEFRGVYTGSGAAFTVRVTVSDGQATTVQTRSISDSNNFMGGGTCTATLVP